MVGFAAGGSRRSRFEPRASKGCQDLRHLLGLVRDARSGAEPRERRAHLRVDRAGKLSPHVDGVFPFADAKSALERMGRREVRGKFVACPQNITKHYRDSRRRSGTNRHAARTNDVWIHASRVRLPVVASLRRRSSLILASSVAAPAFAQAIEPPKLVSDPRSTIPRARRRQDGHRGRARERRGFVGDVAPEDPEEPFASAAVATVKQWRFEARHEERQARPCADQDRGLVLRRPSSPRRRPTVAPPPVAPAAPAARAHSGGGGDRRGQGPRRTRARLQPSRSRARKCVRSRARSAIRSAPSRSCRASRPSSPWPSFRA